MSNHQNENQYRYPLTKEEWDKAIAEAEAYYQSVWAKRTSSLPRKRILLSSTTGMSLLDFIKED